MGYIRSFVSGSVWEGVSVCFRVRVYICVCVCERVCVCVGINFYDVVLLCFRVSTRAW